MLRETLSDVKRWEVTFYFLLWMDGLHSLLSNLNPNVAAAANNN